MEYLSKTYRLDEQVISRLGWLKVEYGSVNKGLRAVLVEKVSQIDPLSEGRGKVSTETFRGPLLKPPEKKG